MITEGPSAVAHVDITEASGKTSQGNTHILTIVDHFSGLIKAYPIPQATAMLIGEKLLDYVCNYGLPLKFVLNNDPTFQAEVDLLLKKFLGMEVSHIAPYNPKANAKVEC